VPKPPVSQFYRLLGCEPANITGIVMSGSVLVIGYQ
jgi:hypothetical protein